MSWTLLTIWLKAVDPFNKTSYYCYVRVVSSGKGYHPLYVPEITHVSWNLSRNNLTLLCNNRNVQWIELCVKHFIKGGIIATGIPLIKWNVVVHMSQILCCPKAWILEFHSMCGLFQTRPPQWLVWYFAILLSSYTYKGYGPLKLGLQTPGGPWTNGWEALV